MIEDLKYTYDLTLSLAKPGSTLTEKAISSELEKGVEEYNRRSLFMANPKKIELRKIADDYVELRLRSTNALATPGRGIRALTTILLQSSDYFKYCVTPGGQLFRVISISQPQPSERSLVDPAHVSDQEFLKALIDYFWEERSMPGASRKEKRSAIDEMKKLAAEVGIIQQKERNRLE
jgi:hypothetical protein